MPRFLATRGQYSRKTGQFSRSCSVQLPAAREWAKIAIIPCKGRAPMTWRWTVSIAALAGVALASLVLASSDPKASEQAAIKLAGAGTEAGQAAGKDESEGPSPQDDTSAMPAEPAADKQAAPAEAAKDGKEQEK